MAASSSWWSSSSASCPPGRGQALAQRPGGRCGQAGFTFLALLFMVAVLGVGMAALGSLWSTAVKRDREAQLLQLGRQFERALASYYLASPGGRKHYPARLEDLLRDNRFPNTVRHLRQLHRDPMSGKTDWGLVRDAAGGIVAVFSLSEAQPLKQAGFGAGREHFEASERYREWVFKASGPGIGAATPAATPVNAPLATAGDDARTAAADACLQARIQGNQECLPLYQVGDLAAWRECIAPVMLAYRECVRR